MTRNVIVTGGSTGIGRACAEWFVAQGDQVTITGRRAELLRQAADEIHADAVAFDASDPAQVTEALTSLPNPVDVLVNNAGGNTDRVVDDPGDDLAALATAWQANLTANLLSAVLMTAALTQRLTNGARIISVGSIAARNGAGSYGAAKAAVEAWTADVSRELGHRGITANVVSPGFIAETEFFGDTMTDERRTRLIAAARNGRAGHPGDVAVTVGFLASPEAGHVTGQVVHVNGGAYLGH